MMGRPEGRESGVAFVTVLIITAVLMLMGVTFVTVSTSEYNMASNNLKQVQAFWLAEAGINYALSQKVYGGWSARMDLGNGSFQVVFDNANVAMISTGTVGRATRRIRVSGRLECEALKHGIYTSGGDDVPSGANPFTYDPPYNDSENGPLYNQGAIPRPIISGDPPRIEPYYRDAVAAGLYYPGSRTISSNTTITGVLYVNGNLTIGKGVDVTVNGTVVVFNGNLFIEQNARLHIIRTRADYASLVVIDPNAPAVYDPSYYRSHDQEGPGSIIQKTGNAELWVDGGYIYCTNMYLKDGQGTRFDAVLNCSGANINGFPSGSYKFDETVYQNPPVGFDFSNVPSYFQMIPGSWMEI
jgi:hypothetical protein